MIEDSLNELGFKFETKNVDDFINLEFAIPAEKVVIEHKQLDSFAIENGKWVYRTPERKRIAIIERSGLKVRPIERGIFRESDGDKEYVKKWIKYAVDQKELPEKK